MVDWILVACLVSLRAEFNKLAPERDRSSDGSIGDAAHASSTSDHNPDETGRTGTEDADSINEVHAIDVTAALRRLGWSMQRCVQIIVLRHRNGLDNRLQNIIYDGLIYSRSWGWTARVYTGSNQHIKHAHFSARYTTAQESDVRPWGLLEAAEAESDDMATITQADFNARMDAWWNDRMNHLAATPSDPLVKLRVAPWHQRVNADNSNTFNVLFSFMRGNIESIAGTLKVLSSAFSAFVAAEDLEDAELEVAVAELRQQVEMLNSGVSNLPSEVLNVLASADTPDEQVAEALRTLLGDRLEPVLAHLAP